LPISKDLAGAKFESADVENNIIFLYTQVFSHWLAYSTFRERFDGCSQSFYTMCVNIERATTEELRAALTKAIKNRSVSALIK